MTTYGLPGANVADCVLAVSGDFVESSTVTTRLQSLEFYTSVVFIFLPWQSPVSRFPLLSVFVPSQANLAVASYLTLSKKNE